MSVLVAAFVAVLVALGGISVAVALCLGGAVSVGDAAMLVAVSVAVLLGTLVRVEVAFGGAVVSVAMAVAGTVVSVVVASIDGVLVSVALGVLVGSREVPVGIGGVKVGAGVSVLVLVDVAVLVAVSVAIGRLVAVRVAVPVAVSVAVLVAVAATHGFAADKLLRGVKAVATVKSARLLSVSVQPPTLRTAALMVLNVPVAPAPS